MEQSPIEDQAAPELQLQQKQMESFTEKLQLHLQSNREKLQTMLTEHQQRMAEYRSNKMYDELKKSLYKQCDLLEAIEKLTKVQERFNAALQKQRDSITKGTQKVEKYQRDIENIRTGLLRLPTHSNSTDTTK